MALVQPLSSSYIAPGTALQRRCRALLPYRCLEGRKNVLTVVLFQIRLEVVGLQDLDQRLDVLVLLLLRCGADDVGVLLDRGGTGLLMHQGVLDVVTGLDGVVAVDDGEVNVGDGAGQLSSLDLLDLDVVGVLLDIVDGSGQASAVTDGDDALGGQQLQSAGLVGGVVGYGDGRAVRNVCQIIALARIDAERLIVDRADADQMGAVLLVEAVEVGVCWK